MRANLRARRVRCVQRVRQGGPPHVALASIQAWRGGLDALVGLQRLAPEAAALIAERPLTPGLLVRAGETFLALINQQIPLQMSYDLELAAQCAPIVHLQRLIRNPEAAGWEAHLADLASELEALYPEGFGVGMSAYFDEAANAPDLLTVALWRLLDETEWSTGLDWDVLLGDYDPLGPDRAALVQRLRPLPGACDIDALCQRLTIPRWPYTTPPGTLIAYAVERTDNPLANLCTGPADGYPTTFEWRELLDLLPLVPEARQIERDYAAWARAINADPGPGLRSLARALTTATRQQLAQRPVRSAALIDQVLP